MKKYFEDKKKIFKLLVMVYFIISPIFDLVFLYNHATTLIRVIILLVFVIITLVMYEDSRKNFNYLLAYYLALIGYLIISYIHSQGFNSLVPGNFYYSVISEASTLLKLAMPFTVLFIIKYQKYEREEFFKVINLWCLIIAGSIVFFNVIGYSLSSYTNEITTYSIFSWLEDLSFNLLATKGFFVYANQESIILLLILVILFYETVFKNKKYILLVALTMLSMLMLGTRVSSYGGLLSLLAMLSLYFVYSVIKHIKISKRVFYILGISFIWILLLLISPSSDRVKIMYDAEQSVGIIEEEVDNSNDEEHLDENEPSESDEEFVDDNLSFIDNNINRETVGRQFYLEYYPYNYDMDFWLDVIEYQKTEYIDYRKMEIMIVKRVREVDDRILDYIVGLSNTRIQNIMNIERDFILHYFAFGVLGSILVLAFYLYMPYICVRKTLMNLEFINVTISCTLCLFILASFMTGNSLNFLATIIPCAFIVSFIGKYKDC